VYPAVPSVEVTEIPADALLLDIREPEEWAAGHIEGALHVPMMSLPQRLHYEPDTLATDRPVVVVCKMGGRSAQVTAWLCQQGYDASNLLGGMLAWQAAGRALTGEPGAPAFVL
jgi:rhodanese-related sulfurtransferase